MSDVNPCFSQDMWFEILKNLPVKTLGKCRCVCKSWQSLIVSPSFMAAHLKHYTQNDTNSLLLYRDILDMNPEHEHYLFFLDFGRVPLQRCHIAICPFKIDYLNKKCSYFVGSIHGLLCLSDKPYLEPASQIMIWNPFLQKMINLPLSMAATIDSGDLTSVLGFGYDNNKNDHRVVKISFSRVIDHAINPFVEVYSVCKRIWNTIPGNYLADNSISSLSYSHCFLNGVIHWLGCEVGSFNSLPKWVLLFDVAEETFRKVKLPESMVNMSAELNLCEYKTKLSVLHCEYYKRDGFTFAKCQIWVKEEESWSMILDIAIDDHYLVSPLEYLGRNGKLFEFARDSDGMLVFYDVTKREFSGIGLYRDVSSKFAVFTDSLVLLDQDTDVNPDDELKRSCRNRPQLSLDYMSLYDDLSEYGKVDLMNTVKLGLYTGEWR